MPGPRLSTRPEQGVAEQERQRHPLRALHSAQARVLCKWKITENKSYPQKEEQVNANSSTMKLAALLLEPLE